MKCLTVKETIDTTFEIVKDASYSEKRHSISDQNEIDNFLDDIIFLKEKLNTRSERIEYINKRLEELTWLNNIEEDSLQQINILIGNAKDLHSVLIRQFANLNNLRKKGIAKEAIQRFKLSIDDLKEIVSDLDSVFFAFPGIHDFLETTRELSLI